jgi:hypothetical protein
MSKEWWVEGYVSEICCNSSRLERLAVIWLYYSGIWLTASWIWQEFPDRLQMFHLPNTVVEHAIQKTGSALVTPG